MRRDEELRMSWRRQVVDDLEECELSLRGKRRLGLIENVESLLEAVGKQEMKDSPCDCPCSDLPPYARRSETSSMYVAKL